MYIVVGLGNPGEEYSLTRHNTGRMAADFLVGKVKGIKVFTPDTYMNKSGQVVAKVIKSKKAAKSLIIIHDDLDLSLGALKISYNRGSGGHKGVESIISAIKTKEFIRIRIGISRMTPRGRLKKPKGDKEIEKQILGEFKKPEQVILSKVFKKVVEAAELIVDKGLGATMNRFN